MQAPVTISDKTFIAPLLKQRAPGSHKGDHGHALLLAGEKGKMGAAVIAATACLRAGAGLLTVNVPAEERLIVQATIPEAMLMMREEGGDIAVDDAIGIGPAIGTGPAATALLTNLLEQARQPLVLDADALTIVSQHKDLWGMLPAGTTLTPHPGEFDRLFGRHDAVEERNAKAIELSLAYQLVIVLKGPHTLVCHQGQAYENTTGNAGLAKGGSGDALTGIILSLLAQGYEPRNAAIAGVYLHGLAADIAVRHQSPESLLITDIFAFIGQAFNDTRSDK